MMSHIVHHVALEPIEGRYSAQWLKCIKREFEADVDQREWKMVDLLGDPIEDKVTSGAFLDFAGTNVWKASQTIKIANMFAKGFVKPGDVFLFTDAWNPAILNVRYMADLLKIPVRIVSYWHAGSYDKWDTLGYTIKDRTWSIAAEQSFFHASDVNVFATEYHAEFFKRHCLNTANYYDAKIVVSGQPHYEIIDWFGEAFRPIKENVVLFPHRLCIEKRPEIFDGLKELMPQYTFIRTQDLKLTKDEYYSLMLRSKVVFSAAEHEMLGISQMEAVAAGCVPIMPDRLSYHEIFDQDFLYPSEWTQEGNVNWQGLVEWIDAGMKYCQSPFVQAKLEQEYEVLKEKYLTSKPLWDAITEKS